MPKKRNQITTTSDYRYLTAIKAINTQYWYCRAVDISRYISITPWSVSTKLKDLVRLWFIEMNEHKMVTLTILWKSEIKRLLNNTNILFDLFSDAWVTPADLIQNITKFVADVPQSLIDELK